MRLSFYTLVAALSVAAPAAHAASFWEKYPAYEPDACTTRIEAEGTSAKQLTGEIGPEDLQAVKGQQVLIIEAEFKEGDYTGIDLSGFFFQDAVLSGRTLTGAKFKGAILDSSVFSESDVSDADFSGATLCGPDFSEANLGKANFKGALLVGADFSLADMAGAIFDGAKIYGGIYNSAIFDKALFRKAVLYCRPESVDLPCASAEKSSFKGADFSDGALLLEIDGDFSNATLEGAAVIAEMIPRLKDSFFVRIDVAPHPLGPAQPPLTLTRQDVSLLISGWDEQLVAGPGAPSFDCRSAHTKAEVLVCRSPELSARDLFLAKLYEETLAAAGDASAELVQSQQDWMKAREECAAQPDAPCLPDIYDQRAFTLAALRGKTAPREANGGGYSAVADFATVPRNVLGSQLGERLAALRARSTGQATIEPSGEGRLTFAADSVGGGGHTCSLSGEFSYEAARGIYTHRIEAGEIAQLIVAGDMILFLGAQDYCGLRAQWPRVMRLQAAAN